MSIGAPTEVSQQILRRVWKELRLPGNLSLACVDVQQTRYLHEMQEENETWAEDFAVLSGNAAYPAEIFVNRIIEVGIKAYQDSCSVAQDNGHSGISASTKLMKYQRVSNLFDRTHPTCLFPSPGGSRQEIADWGVMVMLCGLGIGGFGSDVWKKTKDEMLTLRAIADRIVDITFKELVRGRKRWE